MRRLLVQMLLEELFFSGHFLLLKAHVDLSLELGNHKELDRSGLNDFLKFIFKLLFSELLLLFVEGAVRGRVGLGLEVGLGLLRTELAVGELLGNSLGMCLLS